MDEHQTPVTTLPVAERGLDFRTPRVVGDTVLDDAFTGFPDGEWTLTVREPGSGLAVELISDARYAQVYSGDGMNRAALAVEPMSCAPDAFNSGDGLVMLVPGMSHRFDYRLRVPGPRSGVR
ncbi:MAG: hypothetical protein QM708_00655 [Propioniciclava sp.]|uniref:aldose epimerase family protein n=1 Tax=Propioniciclava sp. TaxID=2038686 RepID=UPI0039E706AE